MLNLAAVGTKPPTVNLSTRWPKFVQTEAELEEVLSRPSQALLRDIQQLRSPLVILGAGGKLGPSLSVLAARAARTAGFPLQVVAVSRFRDQSRRQWLKQQGVETLSLDLLDPASYRKLPPSGDVVYLVGQKFGTTGSPASTWATNTFAPLWSARKFTKSRFAVLSTGNVYPLSKTSGRGPSETTPPAPQGEYANAALARERIFEWHAEHFKLPSVILRLNYAAELRYGVPVDIATKVWNNQPIDLTNGWFNCIWQRDANEMILRSLPLASAPPQVFNLTGLEQISVRELAIAFGQQMQRRPRFLRREASTAILNDARRLHGLIGSLKMPCSILLRWTAHWVMHGGVSLDKPTHFEVRNGKY